MTYIKYAAVLCFILAMASELIGFVWLHRLHIAASNPKALNHQLLKQIFLRFTNCAKLNIQIANTPAFVTRYLSNYTYCGLHYNSFEKIGFTFAISGIAVATYGTFQYTELFLRYALMAILVAIVYAFFCSLLDIKEKQQQIVVLITDYLDNTLSHRLASRFAAPAQQPSQIQPTDNTSKNHSETTPVKETAISTVSAPNPETARSVTSDSDISDEIIFSVINDFLI